MHVQSCLHPVRIRHPYTKDFMYVPCGKCEACLNKRASTLIQKLENEKSAWKHCIFFTLSYDNEHLPVLKVQDNFLLDNSPKRVHPILGNVLIDKNDFYFKAHIKRDDILKSNDFIDRVSTWYGGLPYLSSVDIQRFMKRLRITISRRFNSQNIKYSIYNEKSIPKVRYFICGEYGPSTFRPHYHGILFFSSDWLNTSIYEFINACWKYGNVDSSYSWGKSIGYVAKYCNGTTNLPAIYKASRIRPFSLYSKHPALGTLFCSEVTYKSYFEQKAIFQEVLRCGSQSIQPLYRCMQDRLYPRLTAFSEFTFTDLYSLYTIPSKYDTFPEFAQAIVKSKRELIIKYLDLLRSGRGVFENCLHRWYDISCRISLQSYLWDISERTYVHTIVDYFHLLDMYKLEKWYEFSEDYVKDHPVSGLFCFDLNFAHRLLDGATSLDCLDATEIYYLQSFGIEFDKWFSPDEEEKRNYRCLFSLDNSDDFYVFKFENELKYKNSTKTKRKNDYLNAHPDLLQTFGDLVF